MKRSSPPALHRRLARVVVAVASFAGAPTHSVGLPPEAPIDEIVDCHVAARGGLERIRAIETLVYRDGRYREPGYVGSGKAFMAFKRPYLRVVGNPEDAGTSILEGYDGAAWEWYANPGVVVRTVGAASGATRRGTDFEGPLVAYREKGSTVERGADATIDGRRAFRLTVTTRDGFARDFFVDPASCLIVAERRTAKIHAFGEPVASETRIGDWRPVAGVLFAHSFAETAIDTGEELSSMQWGRVEADRELPDAWFEPPRFERTLLQRLLEHLYAVRTDVDAMLWSLTDFRRAHPAIDIAAGLDFIGYQILKMGETAAAVRLLEENAAAHSDSPASAFALGRAYREAGRPQRARAELERALRLDPEHRRARRMLEELATDDSGRLDL